MDVDNGFAPSEAEELVERLRYCAGPNHFNTPTPEEIRQTIAALQSLSARVRELEEALEAAERADRIHSKCEECMEYGQAAEACGECFPSADDARVMRRNVLAEIKKGKRRARTALHGSEGENE